MTREPTGEGIFRGKRDWLASLSMLVRRFSPSYGEFLPRLPLGSMVLDVGCGGCSSIKIISGIRPDLKFYGVDIAEPEGCDSLLAGFRKADLNRDRIDFEDGFFDAVRVCHLLEHLTSFSLLRQEIPRLLKAGGWAYVEAPNPNSVKVPSFSIFRDQGGCFNFHDDSSHVRPLSTEEIETFLSGCGLEVVDSGVIRNPIKILLFPAIIAGGLAMRKRSWLTDAAWELSGWCSFAIGRKPDARA